uniref:Leucine--tRNA ligase n=1 Tax=Anthurium amnicola TaxID=1678845 RepID=A0A1D1Y0K7_9ARAE
MESDTHRSLSMRVTHKNDRNDQTLKADKGLEGSPFSRGGLSQEPLRTIWRKGFIRLVFVSGIVWMLLILVALLFHVWSCHSSISFLSAICKRDSKVLITLDSIIDPKPAHRCPIPLAVDPDDVVIPEGQTPDTIPKDLKYVLVDESSSPLFGGHQSWKQRDNSFRLNKTMKVHCGFMKGGGGEMDAVDVKFVQKCRFVVASGIFDGYDTPHQPSNISLRSQKLFCFLMVVDDKSLSLIRKNVTVRKDSDGGKWVGIWRLVTLHNPPYDEPRRNGKVPKILTHRLFPRAQFSIWIDGKMELIVDPLLILERYLWRGNHTFAIACHKHHKSIYEEADAIKRRKRYARPLIDLHMKIYRYEGMEPWNPNKGTVSDVPEGAVLIREHTAMTNLFSCLWFNEVNLFTPRDQLSFGYVVYRLGDMFKFLMFPNCEYNSLFILHKHNREHSSVVEWVKSLDELNGKNSSLKESRGGLGLWSPYPGDLKSVKLPHVTRTYPAG